MSLAFGTSVDQGPSRVPDAPQEESPFQVNVRLRRMLEERTDALDSLTKETNRMIGVIADLEYKLFSINAAYVKVLSLLREADNTLQELGISYSQGNLRERISGYLVFQHLHGGIGVPYFPVG